MSWMQQCKVFLPNLPLFAQWHHSGSSFKLNLNWCLIDRLTWCLSCVTDRWAGWLLHPDRPTTLGDPGHNSQPLHQSHGGDPRALHLLHPGDWLTGAVCQRASCCYGYLLFDGVNQRENGWSDLCVMSAYSWQPIREQKVRAEVPEGVLEVVPGSSEDALGL